MEGMKVINKTRNDDWSDNSIINKETSAKRGAQDTVLFRIFSVLTGDAQAISEGGSITEKKKSGNRRFLDPLKNPGSVIRSSVSPQNENPITDILEDLQSGGWVLSPVDPASFKR
jgi:hypothetical protein